jgi:hypothetical protein
MKELKLIAVDTDRSFQEVATEAFEEYLQKRRKRS